jgi:hypothetical protein
VLILLALAAAAYINGGCKMRYILAAALLLATASTASAQGYFGGNDGGMGRYHGYVPSGGPWCPINLKDCKQPHDTAAPQYHPKRRVRR